MSTFSLPVDSKELLNCAAKAVHYIVYPKFKDFFSSDEVEDLVSTVVEKMLKALDRYDPEKGKLSTWANTIALNTVNSEAAKKKVRNTFIENNSQPKSVSCFADQELEYQELKKELFLKCRNPRDQRILQWKMDGMDLEEMAQREGITMNSVYLILYHLRKRLRTAA